MSRAAEHLFAALVADYRAAFAAVAARGRPHRRRDAAARRDLPPAAAPGRLRALPRRAHRSRAGGEPAPRRRPPRREPAPAGARALPRGRRGEAPDFETVIDLVVSALQGAAMGGDALRDEARDERLLALPHAARPRRLRPPASPGEPAWPTSSSSRSPASSPRSVSRPVRRAGAGGASPRAATAPRASRWASAASSIGVVWGGVAFAVYSRALRATALFDLGAGWRVLRARAPGRRLRLLLVPPPAPRGARALGGPRHAPLEPALQLRDRAAPDLVADDDAALLRAARLARLRSAAAGRRCTA